MDPSEKDRVEKAALRKRRQHSVAAGTSRFAELEQAVQDIRLNTLLVMKTPYYRDCKAARNIRRGMRVIRELCKQMRSETVTIGKDRKEKGDSSKRRKLGGGEEQATPSAHHHPHPGTPMGNDVDIDPLIGGSPAVVNFDLFSQNDKNIHLHNLTGISNFSNTPIITEISDSP